MPDKENQPSVKQAGRNAKETADFLYGSQSIGPGAGKVSQKHPEEESDSIRGIRNDKIREDGMRMAAACAIETKDMEAFLGNGTVMTIDNEAVIVSMRMAVSCGSTDRTGCVFGTKVVHETIEEDF